jgi:hypothetical protein
LWRFWFVTVNTRVAAGIEPDAWAYAIALDAAAAVRAADEAVAIFEELQGKGGKPPPQVRRWKGVLLADV